MVRPELQDSVRNGEVDAVRDAERWLAGIIPGDKTEDGNSNVDIVFVHGMDQRQEYSGIIRVDGKKIDPHVFAYSPDAITHRSGLDDLAHRLLWDVQRLRLRHGSESDRPLSFVCHDYGGTIVKWALVMASRTESFAKLLASVWLVVFIGCPQRCDRAGELENKFAKLLTATPRAYAAGVARLASAMAETTRAATAEFVSANLLARVSLCATYSGHDDASLRIFDRADVCFLVSRETRWRSDFAHEDLCGTNFDLGSPPPSWYKDGPRDALLRMSSPIYPQATYVPDSVQLDRLTSEPSFRSFARRRAGISILEVFGHGDARTAGEYIFDQLVRAREASMEASEGTETRHECVLFYQFNSNDVRFMDIGCMLRTMIAQMAKIANRPSTIHAISDRVEELADNGVFWTDVELYDFWVHLITVVGHHVTWLVLAGFDECDEPSRDWFLSRLSSSIVTTELSLKLVVTHNIGGSGDELRTALRHLASNHLGQRLATERGTADPDSQVLYSLDMDKSNFTASTRLWDRPPSPLVVTDTVRFPQSAELWRRLKDVPEAKDALATWIEHNKKNAEQMSASILPQLPALSFASICRAILDAVSVEKRSWARRAMAWLALSLRPLTVEEAAVAVGLPKQQSGEPDRPCSGDELVAALRKHFGGLYHVVHDEVWGGPQLWQAVKSASGEPGTEASWYELIVDGQGHEEVTKVCLQYLRRPGMRDALERLGSAGPIWAQDAEDVTGPDTRLLAYATSNWPLHYRKSNFSLDGFTASDSTEPGDVVAFLAEDTLREPWARAYRAVAPGRSENTASETFSPLRVCAWLGLDHLLPRFGSGARKQAWQQAAIEAAAHGRIETLRSIFTIEPAAGADLNPDKAIRAAMSSRKEEVILEILSKLRPATNSSPSWVPDLLLQSSRLGFTSVVRKLLGPPWDASCKTAGTLQPLHYAARGDHLEIAKFLHKAGADLAGTLDDGSEPPMSPLMVACDHASPQVAKFLVECGARTDITAGGERAWTPLQFAAAGGCYLAVESILSDGRDSLDRYEPDAEHPAALAAVRGYWRCIEALCHPAGDFEMVVNGKTLLSHAVANGDVDMARMLLRKGAQLGGRHAEAQATLLHEAVKQNNDQMVALLVDHGADVNAKCDSEGNTPLCLAAGRGLTDMVKWLLDRNAAIDKHGAEGKTPLYWAAYNRNAKTLELLLERGADVEGTTTDDGLRPIHVAYDSAEATRALLRRGAKCNRTSPWGTALFLAARINFLDTVQVLLDNDLDGRSESCNVDAAEDNGETPLSAALGKGNEDVVLALLDAGADVNRTGVEADADKPPSLLHKAVERGSKAIVAKMLQCRANVDARDAAGNTPLNWIQHDTPVAIARMLLCAGADVESANDGGYTPVWTALRAGNAAVTKLLLGPRGRAKVNLVSGGRDNDSVAGQSSLLQWACINVPPYLVEAVVRLGAANVNIDIPGLWGTPLQAVCFRLPDSPTRPSSPPTAAAAAEDDMTTLSAEIIGLMRLLLNKGAELNPPRPSKGALGYAVNAACLVAPFAVVRFLIRDRAARVDVCDSPARRTPLHFACYRDARFVDAVLSGHTAHARATGQGRVRLDADADQASATQEGDGEQGGGKAATMTVDDAVAVRRLMSSTRDVTGRLPLHYAAASGKPDLVGHVLDKLGIVGPEATAAGGDTATVGAAHLGDVINDTDARGWTPLHWAARAVSIWRNDKHDDDSQGVRDHAAVVRLLIARGANPRSATAQGPISHRSQQTWTPLEVARYHNAPDAVLELLAAPTESDRGRPVSGQKRRSGVRPGKARYNLYCDCCFLAMVGTAYRCVECGDYFLCFTCYGAHDVLHPPPHASFVDVGIDDDDAESEEHKDTRAEEEEAGPLSGMDQRPASPGSGEPFGEDPGQETARDDGGSPAIIATDLSWRWEVADGGDIMLQPSGTP